MSGLGVLALAASAAGRRPAAALRSAVPVLFAVALAAVQLLPTLGRLADSPRKDIPTWHATLWSMPPERLAEVVFPRFFGDPTRNLEGRYFGWKLEDRDYPYVESIYPGLLLACSGAAALIRWRIPRRSAWALAVLAGVFLALGRHNPVYEALREAVPLLAVLRFPEKFAILAVLALALAGVLGWQRLLDEREAGRAAAADFPLALAGVALRHRRRRPPGAAPGAARRPLADRRPWRARPRGARPGQPRSATCGARGGPPLATAAAVAALLALCRWRRPSRRLLEGLAVALLAADLWHYGHGLIRTLPADRLHRAAAARGAAARPPGPGVRAAAASRRPRDRAAQLGGPADADRPHLPRPAGALLGAALAPPLRLQHRFRPDAHRLGAAGAEDPRRRVGAAADGLPLPRRLERRDAGPARCPGPAGALRDPRGDPAQGAPTPTSSPASASCRG